MNDRVITTRSGVRIEVGQGRVGSHVLGHVTGYNLTPPPPPTNEGFQTKALGIAPIQKFQCLIRHNGMTTYGQCGIRWFHHLNTHSRGVVKENSNDIVEWLLMMTDPKTIREGIAMTTTNGGMDVYWKQILLKAGFEPIVSAKNGNTNHRITIYTKVIREIAVRKPRRKAA